MEFGKKILNYKNEIIKDLEKFIKIKSCAVYNPANEDEPYGKECKQALDFISNRAKQMGFRTKNIKNYASFVEFGDKTHHAAVLSHVDVVPANKNGWNSDPFALVNKDGRLCARGIVDNKGPAIISLYCLKVLKENGIEGNRNMRLIFGSGEECGMRDMDVYLKNEPLPDMAFTPDSEYGICYQEKGILQLELSKDFKDGPIKEVTAGTVVNAVADTASFTVASKDTKIIKFLESLPIKFEHEVSSWGLKVKIFGVSAHASCPEKGQNSIPQMLSVFDKFFKEQISESVFEFLKKFIDKEIYGESLKISYKDDSSGPITVNMGVLKKENQKIICKIDIRLSVSACYEKILKTIKNKCEEFGISLKIISYNEALDIKEDSKIIKILKEAYKQVTKKDAKLMSTSGGTYARTLKSRAVAFGPVFPPEETRIHEANESINIENFFLHACVCLEAMKGMMQV